MKNLTRRLGIAAAVLGLIAGAAGQASAGLVIGSDSLVDSGGLAKLEGWLDEDELTLTRIFTHTEGDGQTAFDFHAAANGQGRTFSVLEVHDSSGDIQLIGGYNPRSWNSSGTHNFSVFDANRTAFLFNLTTDEIQHQRVSTDQRAYLGLFQTFNGGNVGPVFGVGFDLHVSGSLSNGYAFDSSYTSGDGLGGNILKGIDRFSAFTISRLEVYTISPYTPGVIPTPEPSSIALVCTAIPMGLGFAWRRRRNQATC